MMVIDIIKKIISEFRLDSLKKRYEAVKAEYNSGSRGRSRVIIIALSAIFVLDYCMFSYQVESSVFNIFPDIPVLEKKKEINIYIPSKDSGNIISEKRQMDTEVDSVNLIAKLFKEVVAGSYFENTSANVPVKLVIKKIWLVKSETENGTDCYIDLMPVILKKETVVIAGSEKMLRQALDKTVRENVPGINRVMLLEKGVPAKSLWDTSSRPDS